MRRCLLLLCLPLLAAPAHAATLSVGPGGYATIGAAIAAAKPGDTVRIAAGTYREALVLSKPLSLVGEGMPTVDGNGAEDVITVLAPDCRISGLRVVGSGAQMLSENSAIKVLADRSLIEDLHIETPLYGLYFANSDHHRVRRNDIRGLETLSANDRGDGIRLHESRHNLIEENTITGTRDGIYFNGAGENDIRGNTISQVRYGLHYMYSDDNRFSDNRFTETEAGSALMFSRRITLTRNVFTGNRGYRAYGVLLKDCEDSVITHNLIAGNRTGVFLDGAIANHFKANAISSNDVGLEIRASSEANKFEGNTIAGNTDPLVMPTGTTHNEWDGNYWSDYRGYDLDGDGRGDLPHRAGNVFGYLTENLPPARLFLLSPAVQALEFAERTLPVLEAPHIEESSPAMAPIQSAELPVLPSTPPNRGFTPAAALLLLLGLAPLRLSRKAFDHDSH
ncbi:Periplasmic copper-binding protein (NosD) [compost metagenome]